ncbi:hypothetical protein J4Q44_G00365170, partial [Coregonus suidteri]
EQLLLPDHQTVEQLLLPDHQTVEQLLLPGHQTVDQPPLAVCLPGRWWLVRSRSLRCGRFLHLLWTSRGPRRTLSVPSWIRGVGPSVPRGVGGVRSGGTVLGPGEGYPRSIPVAGFPPSPSSSPCSASSWPSPRPGSARCWICASRGGGGTVTTFPEA